MTDEHSNEALHRAITALLIRVAVLEREIIELRKRAAQPRAGEMVYK